MHSLATARSAAELPRQFVTRAKTFSTESIVIYHVECIAMIPPVVFLVHERQLTTTTQGGCQKAATTPWSGKDAAATAGDDVVRGGGGVFND